MSDKIWSGYFTKFGKEPKDARQLQAYSRVNVECQTLSYKAANDMFSRNKGTSNAGGKAADATSQATSGGAANADAGELGKSQREVTRLKKQVAELQKEVNVLKGFASELDGKNHSACGNQTDQFWRNVEEKLLCDPDAVKMLLTVGEFSLTDKNEQGMDLITQAARWGTYDIVQLCLNLHQTDYKTVIENANFVLEFPHIKQLMEFDSLNANVGDSLTATADAINRQKGIVENLLQQLNRKPERKKVVQEALIEMMKDIIAERKAFSDDLLNLCFDMMLADGVDPLKSPLWAQLTSTCQEIIAHGSKRDWFFLNSFIIPSTIWLRDLNKMTPAGQKEEAKEQEEEEEAELPPSYLYYPGLLDLVTGQAEDELKKLQANLQKDAEKAKDIDGWQQLITFSYVDESFGIDCNRQDKIPNGMKAGVSRSELSSASSSKFEAPEFYDVNEYLPGLLLLAQTVDDLFQQSVQKVFQIDMYSKIGMVQDDQDPKRRGLVRYMRGPVKMLERAKQKAETDYYGEPFPTSACIIDLNRCSLVFDDISTLLLGLTTFINKVKYYQSGNVIGIVRLKNSFKEYVKEAQYADIKLNVVIKGKANNIIGEVQFLLNTMKEYKARAHALYNIQRQEEYIENSVRKILPSLLDTKNQLWVAALLDDVKSLCKLMVYRNKTVEYLLNTHNVFDESIVHGICKKNNIRALQFLQGLDEKLLVKKLFHKSKTSMCALNYTAEYGSSSMALKLLRMPGVQRVMQDDPDQLYPFLCCVFPNGCRNNNGFVERVLSILDIDTDRLVQFLSHEVKMPDDYKTRKQVRDVRWCFTSLLGFAAGWALRLHGLQKVAELVGEKLFCEHVFYQDALGLSPVVKAIRFNLDAAQYLFSYDVVKERCVKDRDVLFQILVSLTFKFFKPTDEVVAYVLDTLNVDEAMLKEMQAFKCSSHWDGHRKTYFDNAAWSAKWWEHSLSDDDVATLLKIRSAK